MVGGPITKGCRLTVFIAGGLATSPSPSLWESIEAVMGPIMAEVISDFKSCHVLQVTMVLVFKQSSQSYRRSPSD